jgi:hypothetical protein
MNGRGTGVYTSLDDETYSTREVRSSVRFISISKFEEWTSLEL